MTALELSANTARYSVQHKPLGKPGGPGLFGDKSLQLPAYIQNVIHGIIRSGTPKKRAYAIGIGRVRGWAEGKGDVSPEVRAAAQKAIAEWMAARAKAKATPNKKGRHVKTSHPADRAAVIELARRVRTEAGARRYRRPIGSLISGVEGPHKPGKGPNAAKEAAAATAAVQQGNLDRHTAAAVAKGQLSAKGGKKAAKAKVAAANATPSSGRGRSMAESALNGGNAKDLDAALTAMGVTARRDQLTRSLLNMEPAKARRRLDVLAVRGEMAKLDRRRASGQITTTQHATARAALQRRLAVAENALGRTVAASQTDTAVELGWTRRVKTPAGEKHYHEPIGSVIVSGKTPGKPRRGGLGGKTTAGADKYPQATLRSGEIDQAMTANAPINDRIEHASRLLGLKLNDRDVAEVVAAGDKASRKSKGANGARERAIAAALQELAAKRKASNPIAARLDNRAKTVRGMQTRIPARPILAP